MKGKFVVPEKSGTTKNQFFWVAENAYPRLLGI
jgi:hypothetical protein